MRKRHRALGAILGALALWASAPMAAQDTAPQEAGADADEAHSEAVRVWNELQEGVRDGTLTKAQAKERLDEYRASRGAPPAPAAKRAPAQGRQRAKNRPQAEAGPRNPAQAKAGFDAAVRKGRLTQAEADEKWERWQRNYERRQAKDGGANSAAGEDAPETPPVEADPQATAPANAPTGGSAQRRTAQNRARARKARGANPPASPELIAMREKLKAAVQNGDLTQDQARQRLVAYMRSQQQAAGGEEELQELMVRFQTARRNGQLSTEQALRFLEPLKLHLETLEDTAEKLPQQRKNAARGAAQRGQRAARRKRAAAEGVGGDSAAPAQGEKAPKGPRQKSTKDVPAQIAALVESGRLTPLEGKARLEVYRRTIEQQQEAEREAAAREEVESRANSELEKKIEEVNTDVRENRLSREDGFDRIQELRREATLAKIERDEANRKAAERKSFQGRLNTAVKAGQLTKAQAAKRLEAYDQRNEQ